jgi:glutamate synthase domain-containing protein 2
MGEDCISPATHRAFSTPLEMMAFIGEMRRLSGGKPAGFKLCFGHHGNSCDLQGDAADRDLS